VDLQELQEKLPSRGLPRAECRSAIMFGKLERPVDPPLGWRKGTVKGTRRFVRSRMTWILALVSLAYSFFLFCYPEVNLRPGEPPTFSLLGAGPTAWLHCGAVMAIILALHEMVLWLVFVAGAITGKF
jgi:hypothetical protein